LNHFSRAAFFWRAADAAPPAPKCPFSSSFNLRLLKVRSADGTILASYTDLSGNVTTYLLTPTP
jgi:hypothetical protein